MQRVAGAAVLHCHAGASLSDSRVVTGMVLRRNVEGSITRKENCKVAVYMQGFDTSGTETKGTVLIKSAEELLNYAKTEEGHMEEMVKGVANAGVEVVASGMAIGEMALHFLEKYNILAIKIPSKFDLRRFCRATGAVGLVKVQPPAADEVGFLKAIYVDEIGGNKCTVLQQDEGVGCMASIVLRGATEGLLNDVERAVDDGINSYKALTKDARALAAGGASELQLARQLKEYGSKQKDLKQYAICAYADALEVVPRTLAENSGINATVAVSAMHAALAAGLSAAGLDVDTGEPRDLAEDGLVDLYVAKWWAIKLATDAVSTVLRVDQIIMAKQAGGPVPKQQGNWDEE
jgi:T-complex protein 1 subunit theta